MALTNITGKAVEAEIDLAGLGIEESHWYDIVSGMESMSDRRRLNLTLQPYDVLWLEPLADEDLSQHRIEEGTDPRLRPL